MHYFPVFQIIENSFQCNYNTRIQEEFEDTKGVIRIRISKKSRQHNGEKKKYKRTNNDLQNIYIAKERVTRTALKTGGELRCSGSVFQNQPVLQTHVFYTSMNISVYIYTSIVHDIGTCRTSIATVYFTLSTFC